MPKVLFNGKLMFPSNYVSAVELSGRDVTVTIAKVTQEVLTLPGGAKDACIVLAFAGKKKRLICNRTNAKTIAEMHGLEGTGWVGKKITLYPTKTKGKGREVVDCIRVRQSGSASGNGNTWAEDDADDSEVISDILQSSEEWQDGGEQPAEPPANRVSAYDRPPTFDVADDAQFRAELTDIVAGVVDEAIFSAGLRKLLDEIPDANSDDHRKRIPPRLRILTAAKADKVDWPAGKITG